jgi:pimeloyl-ACP methyl ester carboxylesterase
MSSTGARDVGTTRPDILPVLMAPAPAERAAYIESRLAVAHRLSGSRLQPDETRLRATIARAYGRGVDPRGAARQFQAILTATDRTARLGDLRIPTVVVHGLDDPLIDVSGGVATARAIPGALLRLIPGMGHDLPDGAWDMIVAAIVDNAARALLSVTGAA